MAKKRTKALKKRARVRKHLTYSFPAPDELIKRIDDHVSRIKKQTGVTVSRSEAVRVLLTKALDAEEQPSLLSQPAQANPKETPCPKCGKPTATAIMGSIIGGDEREVCAECRTPKG